MSASRHLQKIVCVCLLVLLTASSVFGQRTAGQTQKSVLDLIPAKSLFVVRINEFEQTLDQVDKFLTGISPMGLQMLVRAKLGEVLGSPALPGVDLQGSFAAFGVASEASTGAGAMPEVHLGVLIPVSNYEAFIEENPNCAPPDENGVSAISTPGQGQAGKPGLITIGVGSHALVTMGKLYPQVLRYKEQLGIGTDTSRRMNSIAKHLNAADSRTEQQAPVWMYGNVQQVSKVFKPLVQTKFAEMKVEMAKAMKENPQGSTMDVGLIFDMYGAVLELLMDQTQSLALAIHPQPDVLRFSQTITVVPGSDLAGMLVKDSTGQPNRLMGFAQDGAAMSFAGSLGDSWKRLYVKGIDVASGLLGEEMSEKKATQLKQMVTDMFDALEGPVAGTFSIDAKNGPLFDMKYVFGVKDVNSFRALLEESADLFNESGFADMYKGMGIEMDYSVKVGASTYRGITIDSARLTMKSTQPKSPAGISIDEMYRGGIEYRWAVVDKLCALSAGGDAEAQTHQMIDQIKTGNLPKMGSEMQAAFSMLPGAEEADFVLTYNYVRLLNMVAAFAKTPGEGEEGEKAPYLNVVTTSHLCVAGWGGENQARFDIAVPKQHVQEIISAFSALQGQMRK